MRAGPCRPRNLPLSASSAALMPDLPAPPARASSAVLATRSLTKSYGGVPALDHVDITFNAGEVHALLGENGAGKSTLVKIIAGVIEADSGEIVGPAYADGDIAMVFQELSVVPQMSVLDNLALSARSRGVGVASNV